MMLRAALLGSMYEKRFIIVDDITPRLRHWEVNMWYARSFNRVSHNIV